MTSPEHISRQEMMDRVPLLQSKLDCLFPQLLMRSQSEHGVSTHMQRLKAQETSLIGTEVVSHFKSNPREKTTGRTITVNAPYSAGRLRIEQTDWPDFFVPSYEATLFSPPANSNLLDDLEREMGQLRHERDGISLQFRTSYLYNRTDTPDVSVLTFEPFQSGPDPLGRTGRTIGTLISRHADSLQRIYTANYLPRLDEVQEDILANQGIYALLAFQMDQVLAATEEAAGVNN